MIKRLFDVISSAIALLSLGPVIALVAFQIWCKLGSPMLFCQLRPSKHGKPFEMIKFLTMQNVTEKNRNKMPDSERIAPFGCLLRSTSLDELPEIWNVFKGDMSLVGPRPLAMICPSMCASEQARRYEVKPGITGWAQINGRNPISWEDKFKLDVWYVDNQRFWLDLKILLMTVRKGFIREGISGLPSFQ